MTINEICAKAVLSLPNAGIYTGIPKSTLYKLTASRKIPHSKPTGGKLYFDRLDLDNFLRGNRVATREELDDQANKNLKRL